MIRILGGFYIVIEGLKTIPIREILELSLREQELHAFLFRIAEMITKIFTQKLPCLSLLIHFRL